MTDVKAAMGGPLTHQTTLPGQTIRRSTIDDGGADAS
ncbi:hypothetical protein ACSSVZ_000017 [Amorphus sp. MBR-141]|jgi:hypothetical protein